MGDFANIAYNYINGSYVNEGIKLTGNLNNIERNTIQNSTYGISCSGSLNNIHHNNFYNNLRNAWVINGFFSRFFRNYWNESRDSPYPIDALFTNFKSIYIDYIKFDWHPAQEPYEIGGIG